MKEFSDEQKGAVKDAGLGSLLRLQKLDIRRDLCKEVANRFDVETEEFTIGGKRIKISMKESDHILSLPSQGDELKEPPNRHVTSLFDKYAWKDGTNISFTRLTNYLSNNKTYGEDFIRHFVLYAIGVYLCPTLQTYVKSEYLGLIEDVNNIKNLNWTSLVHNFLIASIQISKP